MNYLTRWATMCAEEYEDNHYAEDRLWVALAYIAYGRYGSALAWQSPSWYWWETA